MAISRIKRITLNDLLAAEKFPVDRKKATVTQFFWKIDGCLEDNQRVFSKNNSLLKHLLQQIIEKSSNGSNCFLITNLLWKYF